MRHLTKLTVYNLQHIEIVDIFITDNMRIDSVPLILGIFDIVLIAIAIVTGLAIWKEQRLPREDETIYFSITVTIVIFIIKMIIDRKRTIGNQTNFLYSLSLQLDLLERDLRVWKEKLENQGVAIRDLQKIDIDFYVKNLWNKILGKRTNEIVHKTYEINHKVLNIIEINNIILEDIKNQNFNFNKKKDLQQEIYREIDSLKELICDIKLEIKEYSI